MRAPAKARPFVDQGRVDLDGGRPRVQAPAGVIRREDPAARNHRQAAAGRVDDLGDDPRRLGRERRDPRALRGRSTSARRPRAPCSCRRSRIRRRPERRSPSTPSSWSRSPAEGGGSLDEERFRGASAHRSHQLTGVRARVLPSGVRAARVELDAIDERLEELRRRDGVRDRLVRDRDEPGRGPWGPRQVPSNRLRAEVRHPHRVHDRAPRRVTDDPRVRVPAARGARHGPPHDVPEPERAQGIEAGAALVEPGGEADRVPKRDPGEGGR